MVVPLRFGAAVALLIGLTGCNMVLSKEPWFTAADAVAPPVMRDGLWLSAAPDCQVDEARPVERWPDCAEPVFVRGDERWTMEWADTDARGRHRRTFAGWKLDDPPSADELLVTNGDHLIGQTRIGGTTGLGSSDGVASGEESGGYMYVAIRPTRRDDEGSVVEFDIWLVRCGPLPEPAQSPTARRHVRTKADEPSLEQESVTDRPFPGLTVTDDYCVADSVEALRRATVLSADLGEHSRSHWVRDGWR